MPSEKKDDLYRLAQVSYIIGFPLALFCILQPYCSYPAASNIILKSLLGILVMIFILILTYKIFKQRLDVRRKLWVLGTTILFICGILYYFYISLGIFCPYYGLPPYSANTYHILTAIKLITLFALFFMGGFYIVYFGYAAKVNRIGIIILALVIIIVILNLALEFYNALKVPVPPYFFNSCLAYSGFQAQFKSLAQNSPNLVGG